MAESEPHGLDSFSIQLMEEMLKLQLEVQELRRRVLIAEGHHDPVRAADEIIAEGLEADGFQIERLPKGLYGGMPYTTPRVLSARDEIPYSDIRIRQLIKGGQISGYSFAGRDILGMPGVRDFLLHQHNALQNPYSRRKLGYRKTKKN